jgi:hypothetical protein
MRFVRVKINDVMDSVGQKSMNVFYALTVVRAKINE